MIEIELILGKIINIAATTFWGPDSKPMSAKDFIMRIFGELPKLFQDEGELRLLWGNPDTRKALLGRLAERGYDDAVLKQIRQAILTENSDIFDVLALVADAVDPLTREERHPLEAPPLTQITMTSLRLFCSLFWVSMLRLVRKS